MSDYIRREDALTQIGHDCLFCKKYYLDRDGMRCEYCSVGNALHILQNQPSSDVVPVVRCKDCEYWDRETIRQNSNDAGWWNEAICKEHTIYGNEHRDAWTSAEWYCADGERKDGDVDV